jgi:hypothetical protein
MPAIVHGVRRDGARPRQEEGLQGPPTPALALVQAFTSSRLLQRSEGGPLCGAGSRTEFSNGLRVGAISALQRRDGRPSKTSWAGQLFVGGERRGAGLGLVGRSLPGIPAPRREFRHNSARRLRSPWGVAGASGHNAHAPAASCARPHSVPGIEDTSPWTKWRGLGGWAVKGAALGLPDRR